MRAVKLMEKVCPRCDASFVAKKGNRGFRTYCSNSCAAKEHNKRHGLTETPEHKCWQLLRDRVNNPNHHAWARYGGRGIKLHPHWDVFENFLTDMGKRPGPEYSIDRIDNDGDYAPGNCRWATRSEQSRNRSCVSTPEFDQAIRDGIRRQLSFSQIAREMGRTVGSITARAHRLGLRSGYQANRRIDQRRAPSLLPQHGEKP